MKAYTDLEQSKKLAEILPIESADTYYTTFYGKFTKDFPIPKELYDTIKYPINMDKVVPSWSPASLLNYLREIDFFPKIEANEFSVTMNVCYYDKNEGKVLTPVHEIKVEAESFVDACYELILKLNEMKIL